MRKLLVISNDLAILGAEAGPHTFTPAHETALKAVAGDAMEIVVASPADAIAHYPTAEVVAAFPKRIPAVASIPSARWLHSFSAGVDSVLTPELAHSDITLTNSSGIHATPIAEYIIGACLMFARGFVQTSQNQVKRLWQPNNTLREFRESTILIVGFGEIGKETARLASGFGARVIAVSRSGKGANEYVEKLETSEHLDKLLAEADFVVITLPGTSETANMFDARRLALMKSSAVIVNIGRGGIVNEISLADALNSGRLAGAVLDVFEKEPLSAESPLWEAKKAIITPHHSGLSHKYMDRATEVLCKNIRAYLADEPLPNEVDKTLGY